MAAWRSPARPCARNAGRRSRPKRGTCGHRTSGPINSPATTTVSAVRARGLDGERRKPRVQNFAPAGSSVAHAAHMRASRRPHSKQNLASPGVLVPALRATHHGTRVTKASRAGGGHRGSWGPIIGEAAGWGKRWGRDSSPRDGAGLHAARWGGTSRRPVGRELLSARWGGTPRPPGGGYLSPPGGPRARPSGPAGPSLVPCSRHAQTPP
jgi:hypothetical protein